MFGLSEKWSWFEDLFLQRLNQESYQQEPSENNRNIVRKFQDGEPIKNLEKILIS